MHKSKYINNGILTEDSKIIIGIGDSFCAGTGSESIETWEENDWDIEKMRRSDKAITEGYENSFINVLCKKHMPDYLPINFGMGGRGVKFAIKSLFLHPTIGIEKAKEKIVIFVVSGLERLDFLNDISDESSTHANTIFPTYSEKGKIGYAELTNYENESLYTDQFVYSEFIVDFFMLMQWCEINNAKLLFISAFTPGINRDNFYKTILGKKRHTLALKVTRALVDKIPWHRQIFPQKFECIVHMLLHLEKKDDLIADYKFRLFKIDKTTKHGYMSKCQHPTQKGHELLADIVYEHILNYDKQVPLDFTENYPIEDNNLNENRKNKNLI
jgi:hypothetical protein